VLQHADHEGPGSIAGALEEAGIDFTVVRPDRGDAVPRPGAVDGVVVLGGPMTADDQRIPWLADERALLAGAVAVGNPVLGVCLGAQQLAMALGADLVVGGEDAAGEVGLTSVVLTRAGRLDPVLGPEYGGLADPSIACVEWHRDTFTLPEGAVHLAASRRFPHQAFRMGSRAYGFQFHVEIDDALADGWRRPLQRAGVNLEGPRLAEAMAVGTRILRRFVAVAVAVATGAEAGAGVAGTTTAPGAGTTGAGAAGAAGTTEDSASVDRRS